MIYGIGTDITEVKRFKKWVEKDLVSRFFNKEEIIECKSLQSACEHFAARFAAKEAFSKALGTGLTGFSLKDVYVVKNESGKPFLKLKDSALELFKKRCGNAQIHLSLSHEKEYALAYVIIEILGE